MTLIRALALLACAAGSTNTFAASCKFWHDIKFADGTKGCLTDYSIARMRPRHNIAYLKHLLSGYDFTTIAVTSKDPMCPIVVGLGTLPKSNYTETTDVQKATATAYALNNCKSLLTDKTKSNGAPCDCEIAITNGSSTLTKSAFEAMVGPVVEEE